MLEVLLPAQSAQRSPLLLMTSTAGLADSVVLRNYYDRLIRQATGAEEPDPTFYGAWWESTDPDAGLDWDQIAQANPALTDGRLNRKAIETEFNSYPAESWKRERLNHFLDVAAESAVNPARWAACRTPEPLGESDGPYALGISVAPGWERATLAVSGVRGDGRIGVEIHRDLRGTEAEPVTAERIVQEVEAFAASQTLRVIAFDATSGGAAAFQRNAVETGLPWAPYKPAAMVYASMDTSEMILSGRLAVDDPLLDAQIPTAARRPVGQDGGFRWAVAASLGPIDAVLAMSLAAHAIAYSERPVQIFL
jgi:hypothetical protein